MSYPLQVKSHREEDQKSEVGGEGINQLFGNGEKIWWGKGRGEGILLSPLEKDNSLAERFFPDNVQLFQLVQVPNS